MSTAGLDARLAQAQALLQRGDVNGASTMCREILAADRKHLNAILVSAEIAIIAGRPRDAQKHAGDAVRLHPKHAGLRAKIGHLMQRLGEYTKALEQYEKALRLEPGLVEASVGKAESLERLGRYDRARQTLDELSRKGRLDAAGGTALMRLHLHDNDPAAAAAVGEDLRTRDGVPPLARRGCLFELARAYERLDRIDDAFSTVLEANQCGAIPFDAAAHARRVNDIIDAFPPERFTNPPAPASVKPDEFDPIFIVGLPRSGSTLIERILHAHPNAHGIGESPALHHVAQHLPQQLGTTTPFPACAAELTPESITAARKSYFALAGRSTERKRLVDKNLGNALRVGLIRLLFPNAVVIHATRQPLDLCLSCFFEPLSPAHVPYASRLEDLAAYWGEQQRLMAHWHAVVPGPPLNLAYEDLVGDQEPTTRTLLEACGLPWHEGCLQFHKVNRAEQTLSFDQVRRPLYKSSVGRAEKYAEHIAPLRTGLGL